jgi:hypothetical protein
VQLSLDGARAEISSFGETDESMRLGGGDISVDEFLGF